MALDFSLFGKSLLLLSFFSFSPLIGDWSDESQPEYPPVAQPQYSNYPPQQPYYPPQQPYYPPQQPQQSYYPRLDRPRAGYNPQDDQILVQNIRSVLASDSSLTPSAQNIQINVVNGRVTLYGYVTSLNEKSNVEFDVRRVKGVKGVTNNLTINSYQ